MYSKRKYSRPNVGNPPIQRMYNKYAGYAQQYHQESEHETKKDDIAKNWRDENNRRRKKRQKRLEKMKQNEEERIQMTLDRLKEEKLHRDPLIKIRETKRKSRPKEGVSRKLIPLNRRPKTPSERRKYFKHPSGVKKKRLEPLKNDTRSIYSEPLPMIEKKPLMSEFNDSFRTYTIREQRKKRKYVHRPWRRKRKKNKKKEEYRLPYWRKQIQTGLSTQISELEGSVERLDRLLMDKKKNLKIARYNEKLLKKQIKIVEKEKVKKKKSTKRPVRRRRGSSQFIKDKYTTMIENDASYSMKDVMKEEIAPILKRKTRPQKELFRKTIFNNTGRSYLQDVHLDESMEDIPIFRSRRIGKVKKKPGNIIMEDSESVEDIMSFLGVKKRSS